jgi:hypothetical protein
MAASDPDAALTALCARVLADAQELRRRAQSRPPLTRLQAEVDAIWRQADRLTARDWHAIRPDGPPPRRRPALTLIRGGGDA